MFIFYGTKHIITYVIARTFLNTSRLPKLKACNYPNKENSSDFFQVLLVEHCQHVTIVKEWADQCLIFHKDEGLTTKIHM